MDQLNDNIIVINELLLHFFNYDQFDSTNAHSLILNQRYTLKNYLRIFTKYCIL